MKLIVQIPCLNEARTLPATLAALPRELEGFDAVEWLVVDDGSTDGTAEVARRHGADHLVRLPANRGLAHAFQAGLDASLKLGADVIVNTDGDNQYAGGDVERLVAPILAGRADMVVGDRDPRGNPPAKRALLRLGGSVVRRVSRTAVLDPTSGFRAYTREAALGLEVLDGFTYTLESLIQAGRRGAAVAEVPVRTNPPRQPSRLSPSTSTYVRRSLPAILRGHLHHASPRVLWGGAVTLAAAAAAAAGAFAGTGGELAWLVVGGALLNGALLLGGLGVLADLLHGQRELTRRTLERVRRVELALDVAPARHEALEPEHRLTRS